MSDLGNKQYEQQDWLRWNRSRKHNHDNKILNFLHTFTPNTGIFGVSAHHVTAPDEPEPFPPQASYPIGEVVFFRDCPEN
ncbi:hypothetical protein ACFO5Q_12230 [Kordiimonas lipolytica]|uniref:Uncharacterized protein n=1 Tax=Kordiimonas lipolytica TaxID=1662421 RepID=A0ABV8UCI2_9PROT|nr:hypothetical protein [Kordiimonas lipolytica]